MCELVHMCFLLMERDKLVDPRRIEYIQKIGGGTKLLALDVSRRAITVSRHIESQDTTGKYPREAEIPIIHASLNLI